MRFCTCGKTGECVNLKKLHFPFFKEFSLGIRSLIRICMLTFFFYLFIFFCRKCICYWIFAMFLTVGKPEETNTYILYWLKISQQFPSDSFFNSIQIYRKSHAQTIHNDRNWNDDVITYPQHPKNKNKRRSHLNRDVRGARPDHAHQILARRRRFTAVVFRAVAAAFGGSQGVADELCNCKIFHLLKAAARRRGEERLLKYGRVPTAASVACSEGFRLAFRETEMDSDKLARFYGISFGVKIMCVSLSSLAPFLYARTMSVSMSVCFV